MKAAALIIQSRRKIRIAHKMASTVQRLFSFAVVRQIFDNYEFANYWIYLDIILSILGSQIHRWYVEYK